MSTLSVLREHIAADLKTAGFYVEDHVPERGILPPMAIVKPGVPYVTEADPATMAAYYSVNLVVQLFPEVSINDKEADDLDDAIEAAVVALGDWDITGVETVTFEEDESGSTYPGAIILITKITALGGN